MLLYLANAAPYAQFPGKTSKGKVVATALLVIVIAFFLFRVLTPDPSPAQVEAVTPIMFAVSFLAGAVCDLFWVGYVLRSHGLGEKIFSAIGMFYGASAMLLPLAPILKILTPPSEDH